MTKLAFPTKAEAIQFLNEQSYLFQHSNGFSPDGTYYLAHGEYSKPDFKAVRYKDGWGIKKIHYFYDSTFHTPKDGRCDMLDGMLVLETSL